MTSDIKLLRSAGLTDSQIIAVLEAEQELERGRKERRRTLAAERMRRMRAARRVTQSDASHAQENGKLPDNSMNGYASHVTQCDASHLRVLDSKKERKTPESDASHVRQAFERFYSAYPKHVGRGAAEKAFPKALRETGIDEMLAALERQRPGLPSDRQYICAPARWLNEKRWLDEAGLFGKQPSWREAII